MRCVCVWAGYYKQIRKSEQRPPLHLRAADLVPQPRTPVCHIHLAATADHGEIVTPTGETSASPLQPPSKRKKKKPRRKARPTGGKEQGDLEEDALAWLDALADAEEFASDREDWENWA
jgi:hypothetical protein